MNYAQLEQHCADLEARDQQLRLALAALRRYVEQQGLAARRNPLPRPVALSEGSSAAARVLVYHLSGRRDIPTHEAAMAWLAEHGSNTHVPLARNEQISGYELGLAPGRASEQL